MNDQDMPLHDEWDKLPDRLLKRKTTRRVFIRRLAVAGVAGGSALHWSTEIEPRWIEVRRMEMPLPRLSAAFDGLTIAQISDIHVSDWMTQPRLRHIVQKVNALQPDIVAITGDFVSRRQEGQQHILSQELSRLQAGMEVFAVLGNHDHWANVKFVRNAVRKSGVQELENSFHTIRRDGEVLHICGLDDAWAGAADVSRVLQTLPAKGSAILLAHEPDFADDYAGANRFDLQLAGHTHGGQVQIPLVGPIHLPKYGQKYTHGRYRIGKSGKKMTLYVNRGVGMVQPYVRFHCRPEITLFTLRSVT